MIAIEVALKDIKIIARDYKALALILGMPLILIGILGAALSPMFSPGDRLPSFGVALVDPGGELGGFVREIFDSDGLKDLIFLTPVPGISEAEKAIADGEVACAVILPEVIPGENNAPLQISVLGDPVDSVRTEIVKSILDSFSNGYSAVYAATGNVLGALSAASSEAGVFWDRRQSEELAMSLAKKINEKTWASGAMLAQSAVDPTWISALQYYSVGMSTMYVLFGGMLGVKSFAEERRLNTVARLFASKATKADILLGKTIATFFISFIQVLILIGFTSGVYRVNWGRSVAGVLSVAAALSFAATGFSILLGSLAKTERMADALGNVGIQVMAFLGGCQLPIYTFPPALQFVSKLTLTRWGLQGFLTLMEGHSLAAAVLPVSVLGAMGVFFLAMGLLRIRVE